jgi:hypothetical protein
MANNNPNTNNYTGIEEAVARIISFLVSLIFFSIYSLSRVNDLVLDWSKLMIHLAIFWFVYELCSFGLFVILVQFSKTRKTQNPPQISQPAPLLDKKNDEIQK